MSNTISSPSRTSTSSSIASTSSTSSTRSLTLWEQYQSGVGWFAPLVPIEETTTSTTSSEPTLYEQYQTSSGWFSPLVPSDTPSSSTTTKSASAAATIVNQDTGLKRPPLYARGDSNASMREMADFTSSPTATNGNAGFRTGGNLESAIMEAVRE